jgi:deoxyribodipyrimidine photolyase-related protein
MTHKRSVQTKSSLRCLAHMSTSICLVFPNQLFEEHPAFAHTETFWLVEDELFFGQLPFHQKKLAFHRASMKYYAEYLRSKNKKVTYFAAKKASLAQIFEQLQESTQQVVVVDPTDFLLEKRIRRNASRHAIELSWLENPSFINSKQMNDQLFGARVQRFFLADFYKKQRERLGILLDDQRQPLGGRWSFDTDNRKRLPKGMDLPNFPRYESQWAQVAQKEISSEFSGNPGDPDLSNYPVTHQEAKAALDFFIDTNLAHFGPYQDAFSTTSTFVFHSNLSTALNAGLLLPEMVIHRVLEAFKRGKVSLESTEGFVRQVVGWREFIRAVYERVGVSQRTTNAMHHHRTLNWAKLAQLGIFKAVAHKLQTQAYAHHIERLMLLGNFFFLSETDPDEVYAFFMSNFMDAYDWVMVPNVYGMSQYADGGLMTTKPYFSGSNYLKKQGFKTDAESAALFDALFWHFVDKHQERLRKNMRTVQMVANWNRMLPQKKAAHLERAALFFQNGN